jgi:endonuclease/exonuclease/phosphatase family metal-dependent hydrolase
VQLPHQPGGNREPRVALLAEFDGGLRFISTHFDHTRDSVDRLAQAQAINERVSDTQGLSILAGDFNCGPDSPPMMKLTEQWTLVSGGLNSFSATQPTTSIDHVLIRNAPQYRATEARVIDEAVASDHRPVVVTIERSPQE